jgi:hypothetical protein
MKRAGMLVVVMMLLAGCAAGAPPRTGFLGAYAGNLKPGPEGGAKLTWLKPGVDFSRYKKVMVDYVVFALAEDSEYKYIDGNEMKTLGDAASLALVKAIEKKFPVVSEPGPDVVRIRIAIVDLKQSSPVSSTVTSVIPVGLGISLIKKSATGAWSGSGMTQVAAMFLDSMTNEVIVAGYDEYSAGFTERFTKWGSVEDAFSYWGERGLKSLEVMRASGTIK